MGTTELIIHHEIKQKLNKMKTGGSIGIERNTQTVQRQYNLRMRWRYEIMCGIKLAATVKFFSL